MTNIGLIIKQARLEQGIKQLNLAKGICSVSYLSKVENNQIVPKEEILLDLLNKLSLTINEVNGEEEIYILNVFKEKYKEALLFRNKISIVKEVAAYDKKNIVFRNELYSVNILLMLIRMYRIIGDNVQVNTMLEYVNLHEKKLTNYQKCIFNLNTALYYFSLNEYSVAVKYIEEALYYERVSLLEKWEIADLYNVSSICYLMTNNSHSSIEFAKKSLNLFRDLLFFNRAIDCYITIGIAYKRSQKYTEAEEHFNSALLLIQDRGLDEFNGIVNQNLGSLFSIQGKPELSINYYMSSLKSKKTTEGYLITIFSIIKEYSKLKRADDVIKWCEKGRGLLEKNQYQSYTYHFNIYENLHRKSSYFVPLLIEAIHFFENENDFRHVQKYSILLAEYYYETKKLKNAGIYYKNANQAMLQKSNIKQWEDI